MDDFSYIDQNYIYFDSACQSLRPQTVIDSINNYYINHNSCAGRGKYAWAKQTDREISDTRQRILDFLKLKSKDYFVSFTLNTTYGINLIINSLNLTKNPIKKVITTDIEHNSVFLSTLNFSRKNQIKREIITRNQDGSINLNDLDFHNSLVVLNTVSNIDGRKLLNINEVIKKIKKSHGIVILDAAQTITHDRELLYKTKADAVCFSAHKTYAASLGIMIINRDFAKNLDPIFLGGGMVADVFESSFLPAFLKKDDQYNLFEPGLQLYAEIISLRQALIWLDQLPSSAYQNLENNSKKLYQFLKNHPKINLINQSPSPTFSFYLEDLDSHLLGEALADQNIMCRTGYFCAHYYLSKINKYPPLIRISLGLHNKSSDIDRLIAVLEKI